MKTLLSYLDRPIDGHIHLFDERSKQFERPILDCVGFLDVEPKHIQDFKNCLKLYDKYISSCGWKDGKDVQKQSNLINTMLLATGVDSDDIISIYNKYPSLIKGFGELKCYKYWHGKELGLTLDTYKKVFEFDKELGLPMYIHLTLFNDSDRDLLKQYLQEYPNIPIVLCHCGMGNSNPEQRDEIFNRVLSLTCHKNLWIDLTFDAQEYFVNNPYKIESLPSNRIFLGTDINPTLMDSDDANIKINHIIQNNNILSKFVPLSNSNLRRLFKNQF